MTITPILKNSILLLGIIFCLLGLLLLIIFSVEVGIVISLAVAGIGFVVTAIIIQIPPISISIRVIDENGSLLKHGKIKIKFPENDVDISKEINESGETRIDNVPAQYAKSEFTIKPEIEGYQMDLSKSLKLPKKNRNFEVHVRSKRYDVLEKKKFGVILSGDLSYTSDIYDGFKKKLLECLPEIGYEPIFFSRTGSSEPNSKKTYTEIIEMLLKRDEKEEYDFFVTIGTQASKALNEYFLEKKTDRPLIFMGVTDPVLSKLVLSLKNRQDRKSIAGVSYCGPVENIAANIHYLFPENKLIFIFHKGYEQDVMFAQRLKEHQLVETKHLQLKELENPSSLDDFDEKNAIYFSWYTIENMFETRDGLDIIRQRNVVATTAKNCKSALVAITPNDFLIGEYGANIVVDVLKNKRRLGEIDVREPEINYCINRKIIEQKQLFIDMQFIDKAIVKFNWV